MRASVLRSLPFGAIAFGLVLVVLTAFTGTSSDSVDPLVIQSSTVLPVDTFGSGAIGQTFTAYTDRLDAVELYWTTSGDAAQMPAGQVILHLRGAPGSSSPDLATVTLPLSAIRSGAFTRFSFAPVQDSYGRSFYVSLETLPADAARGMFSLWTSDADVYPGGQMYIDGIATDRDLAFRTFYAPDVSMLSGALASSIRQYGGGIAVALLLLLIPGLAGMWILRTPAMSLMGLGMGIIAAGNIVLLYLKVSFPFLALVGVLFTAGAIVPLYLAFRRGGRRRPPASALFIAALAALALSIGLLQIRDTPVPLWVDSRTHAQLIQELLAQGQLPASSFYHLGFHVITALFVRVTGWAIPQAMLLMGPILFTQIGLSLFVLSRRLAGSTVAGLASAIYVWFLSSTPAYFTTWGRYPLLLGSALLPLALVAAIDWIEEERWSWRLLVLTLLLGAGLAFAHVRLIVFYFAFVAVYAVAAYFKAARTQRRIPLQRAAVIIGWGCGVGLLWVGVVLWRGLSWQIIAAENAGAPSIDLGTAVAVALVQHGRETALLAAAAALVGLIRRSRVAIVALVWSLALFLVALLPPTRYGSPISPDLVVFMSFVPISLVVGECTAFVYARLRGIHERRYQVVWLAMAASIVLIGARDMVSIVNPATILFSQADSRAIAWTRDHTPASAKFLVNSFNWYNSAYVPSDGGQWIPFLSQRAVDYLAGDSVKLARDPDAMADWALGRDIHWVYMGWRPGLVRGADLDCRPDRYTRVYDQQGVRIYEILPPGASVGNRSPAGCDLQGLRFGSLVARLPFSIGSNH